MIFLHLASEIGAVLSKSQGHLSMLGCTGNKPIKVDLLYRCRTLVACAKNSGYVDMVIGLRVAHHEPELYVTCAAKLHLM